MCDLGVVGVGAEAVLLVVAAAEDIIAEALHGEDAEDPVDAEVDGVDSEISRLERVDEGEPGEISESEHESEAVGRDIHGREHGRFHPQGIEDVQ